MAGCFYARVIGLLGLKCIDAHKKVDAVILQVVTARHETSIKCVSPINLGEHMSVGLEDHTQTQAR